MLLLNQHLWKSPWSGLAAPDRVKKRPLSGLSRALQANLHETIVHLVINLQDLCVCVSNVYQHCPNLLKCNENTCE